MKKLHLVNVVLIFTAISTAVNADCFSDRSSLQHFHHFDGTQFSYKFLKHWIPEVLKDFQGTYRSSGSGGGIIIVAHLLDPQNPKSKTVFSGSLVEQNESGSAPRVHDFKNLEIKDGKISDSKFSGQFYKFPHYENQTEYFFVSINDKIYVRTKTIERKVAIDE